MPDFIIGILVVANVYFAYTLLKQRRLNRLLMQLLYISDDKDYLLDNMNHKDAEQIEKDMLKLITLDADFAYLEKMRKEGR